jgi:hypothetical protein
VFRRAFWIAVGVGAGATAVIVASRWVERQRQRLTPANLAERAMRAAASLGDAVADAAREFRAASAEREREILAQVDGSSGRS